MGYPVPMRSGRASVRSTTSEKVIKNKNARTFSISRQSISTRLAVDMTTRSRPVLYQICGRRI